MTIDPARYWQLRALTTDAERAAEKFRAIDAQRVALFKSIAEEHGLDLTQPMRLIDATCEIVPAKETP